MNQQIEVYLKQIEHDLFTCPRKIRVAFLRDFRGNLNAYMEEHPQSSIQELRSVFGSPEEIAEGFLQSDEFDTTKKVVSSKKRIVRIVLIAVCTLVSAALILGTVYVIQTYRYAHGYWVEEPTKEEYTPPNPDALESY